MSRSILILPDQVARNNSALAEALKPGGEPKPAQVLMVESSDFITTLNLTRSALALRLSALRHFALELRRRKLDVDYHPITESATQQSGLDALRAHIASVSPEELIVMEPTTPSGARIFRRASMIIGTPIRVTGNSMFISDRRQTERLPENIDHYYQLLRTRLDVLMEEGKPVGGMWNLTEVPAQGYVTSRSPGVLKFVQDEITSEVIQVVNRVYPGLRGSTDGFSHPVTHAQANDLVDFLIQYGLLNASAYQTIAPLLEIGLLNPHHLVKKAETGFKTGKLSLAAAEGFIREVLGTREYHYICGWIPGPGGGIVTGD